MEQEHLFHNGVRLWLPSSAGFGCVLLNFKAIAQHGNPEPVRISHLHCIECFGETSPELHLVKNQEFKIIGCDSKYLLRISIRARKAETDRAISFPASVSDKHPQLHNAQVERRFQTLVRSFLFLLPQNLQQQSAFSPTNKPTNEQAKTV